MGIDCCSTEQVDLKSEITAQNTLRPCQSQQIGGNVYHSDQIIKIVRLQKRVRDFVLRRKAVKEYIAICPENLK